MVLFASAAAFAQTGPWSGQLDVQGTKLTIVFHLDDDDCKIDSPDQGVYGVPATLERTATGVKVTVASIGASFEGQFMMKWIIGTFTQHGVSFPLTLNPGAPVRNRPQTPRAPFPYRTEEVSFSNGDAVLKGTLTLPEGCTRETPVLIMVTGSGLQNRDEEFFEHKPFAVIADALAREGIATLRYDDRGFGESTGDLVKVTTEDLKDDALAGIGLLRGRFDHVGVIGHSEGGTIAIMLAAERKVDFVVSLAGSFVSGEKVLLQQNRDAFTKAGYAEEVVSLYCKKLEELFENAKEGYIPEVRDTDLPAELEQNLQAVRMQASTPYLRYFLALDVSDRLDKVACPVLALNGTKDTQVLCEENLTILEKGLGDLAEIHPVEGVNHLFQHCKTGDVSEYKDIEETFAPEALGLIIGWLKRRIIF